MVGDATAYRIVLGRVIAALRARMEPPLTQSDLAVRVGVGQATVSRIEAGQASPDVVTFNAIAQALGVTPADLHSYVEQGLKRTEQAARGAGAAPQDEQAWWQPALALAGMVGLAGLAGFAVAALLEEATPRKRQQKRTKRSR